MAKASTHSKTMMALVHTFMFLSMQHNVHVHIQHIAGVNNEIADALSHFEMDRFCKLCLHAQADPLPRSPFGNLAGTPMIQHGPCSIPHHFDWSLSLNTVGALPSLPVGGGVPASLPQHIHSHYTCLLFLQGIQHPGSQCLTYAGQP